jgi:hypothetical protein
VHLHNKEPRPLAIADPARFFQIGKDMAVPDMAEEDTEAKSGAGGTVPPMRFHLGLGTKRRSAGASWTTSDRVGIAAAAPRVTPVRMIASGKRYAIASLMIQWFDHVRDEGCNTGCNSWCYSMTVALYSR